MSNYPDGMTRADYIAVGEIEPPPAEHETRVLRVTVYLTYGPSQDPHDESIEDAQSPFEAEQDIERVLFERLKYRVDEVVAVDAQYMSEEESEA